MPVSGTYEEKEGKDGTNCSCYGSLQCILGKFVYPESGNHVDGPDPDPGSYCPLAGKDLCLKVLIFQWKRKSTCLPLNHDKTPGRPAIRKKMSFLLRRGAYAHQKEHF